MTTTATHLRTIAIHWTDLHDAVGQPTQLGAFGLGLRGYLARLNDADQQEYQQHQAAHLRSLERDPIQLGTRPVPVRLHFLDTMRTVEAALIACADDIAHAAQRTPIAAASARRTATHPYLTQREADIAAADRQRRTQLAHADLVDPKRWRYTGRRTAPHAALWLLARIERARAVQAVHRGRGTPHREGRRGRGRTRRAGAGHRGAAPHVGAAPRRVRWPHRHARRGRPAARRALHWVRADMG